jgi:hypothetical protein
MSPEFKLDTTAFMQTVSFACAIAADTVAIHLARGYRARVSFARHTSRIYRCDAKFKPLLDWLRANGVPGRRLIHTLRKEIGAVTASRDGIFAASRCRRHSDIRVTSRLYADQKTLVAEGLGSLLSAVAPNVIEGEFQPPAESAPQGCKRAAR